MSSRNLVICDPETEYAARLAAFLNGKRELAFQVKTCGSPGQIREAGGQDAVDVLLVSDACTVSGDEADKIFVLASERDSGQEDAIFKYQSGEAVCMRLVQLLAKGEDAAFLGIRKKGTGRILGFYSPVHRLGQTGMALKKGRELAAEENVLYLNLEAFAGAGLYFPEERNRNMSVLLYYVRQESKKMASVLAGLVRRMDGMDYVPPAVIPEDIRDVKPGEWLWLFDEVLRTSIYDTLVLDIGDCVQGLYSILGVCDEIYMPVADDPAAASKIRQFEDSLGQAGYMHVLERVIRCDRRRAAPGKSPGKAGPVKRDRGR